MRAAYPEQPTTVSAFRGLELHSACPGHPVLTPPVTINGERFVENAL